MSLHERIAALSPEKRALLEQQLQHGTSAKTGTAAPAPHASGAPLPLSFAQKRLWVLEQIEPGHSFYHLPVAMRLTGALSAAVLENVLNEIVRRHDALRTTFVSIDGAPSQVIAPEVRIPLEVIDLRATPAAEREAEASTLAAREAQRPFDLARGPLFRSMLLRLDEHDHVLLLTMHHIVSDGWSLGVLQRELSAIYSAFAAGRPSPLPELPIQYADFALWQREHLSGSVLDDLLSYWKQKLAGMPPLLEIPMDRPRPRVQIFRGASLVVPLPGPLASALNVLARSAGATLFMVLLAAFKVLLARYSHRSDIVVGSPIANRTRREHEGLIGFFVNTLVLRTDLTGDPSFVDVLARVRETALEALAHQDLPFEKLVEELQPARDLSHNPLFQIAFGLQNADSGTFAAGIDRRPSHIGGGTSKFDLTLSISETTSGLDAAFEYNTELFDARTIATLARHYQMVLERAAARPERRISELLHIEGEERQRLLAACAGPSTGSPSTSSITEWCERQARNRPGAPAASFVRQQMTWEQLNARASQLAHALRSHGVTRGSFVAVCLERSLDLPVALLGILKSGAAFVPLDPAQPATRLAFMIRDTGARLLITQQRLRGSFADFEDRILLIDDWSEAGSYPESDPGDPPLPDDLAYIIYTSGSTGQPKGVLVPHRGLCNVIDAQRAVFALAEDCRVLQFSSASFDASVFELLLSLGSGGTLVLAPQEELMPGVPLLETLRDERINVIVIPPSCLAMVPPAALPDLNTIISAGEELPPDFVARWAAGRRFFNAYGPTEITIWTTITECRDTTAVATIGRPIANTQVYVLDEHLEPVPQGVPGEIVVAGIGVTRGYHDRPDLTAERFVPDPFRPQPDARMYRTGDRGRILPAGEIQFLGRLDQQVKLRGYRIEPGEIEAALLAHPAVRDAVVTPQRTPRGETRIVAHCVARDGNILDAAALRAFARQTLPEYMLPSVFRIADTLPLTASGKADRAALAALRIDADDGARPAGARTPEETKLVEIWREVLERPDVGIHDGFFDLGGHSLLATRAISRVNDAWGLALPLRTIFDNPSIAEFARAVLHARTEPQP